MRDIQMLYLIMTRRVLILFLMILNSGCVAVGYSSRHTKEYTNFSLLGDIGEIQEESEKVSLPTKQEVIQKWGRPDKIITTAKETEEWIYKREIRIEGITYIVVPLVVPTGHFKSRIFFSGNLSVKVIYEYGEHPTCWVGIPSGDAAAEKGVADGFAGCVREI